MVEEEDGVLPEDPVLLEHIESYNKYPMEATLVAHRKLKATLT